MNDVVLTELELDAITELVNLGVSRAATNLARMVREEIILTVPKVALMSRREAIQTLGERESKSLVAVHQVFEGEITGRALLIFPEERSLELVRAVVGSDLSLEEIIELEQEALAETGNVILNSCLATIANALESNLRISLPEVIRGESSKLFSLEPPPEAGTTVMFIYINFAMRKRDINGYIAMMMDMPSLSALQILLRALIRRTGGASKAQEPMPETQQEYLILDGIAAGLIVLGTDRKIAHWNAWIASASRRTLADVVGKTLAQVFPDAQTGIIDRAIESAFDAGASTLLTNALHPKVLPLHTRAGRPLLHDIVVSPVGDARARKCVVQIMDVTDTTRRERFLRDRQNARYSALVESAPDAILNVDSEGIIRFANPAAARQFGYSAEELIGQPTALLDAQKNAWLDIWQSVSAGTASVRATEVRVRLKDGTLRYFEISAARWKDGSRTLVTAILRDVNDRRDADRALRESESQSRANAKALAELNEALEENSKKLSEMDRRKDEFLATLAHELRNPLAPLRNGLQLLKLAKDDVGLVERTRHMMDLQLGQMVRLIDDLLDVGRITNDRIGLNREKTTLDRVIRQAIETSSPLILAQQHELTIELPSHEIGLDADVVRLTQVFANLLNNAAKYTPCNGKISITAEEQGDSVTVRVSDNGIGIPPDLLPKVFEMFMQVDKSLERAQGGLGIGLSLVKRLVEMHGGTVEAQSKGMGHGSAFIVRMPIAEVPADSELAASEVDAAPPTGHRILVVDDNKDAAASLALLLRLMGHETRTANNGVEAIEVADQFQPDVALLDIGMPKLNGYETARRMRQKTWGREMLLVAVTGWGQEADRRRSNDAGFNSHLVKPVNVEEIERLLARSHH